MAKDLLIGIDGGGTHSTAVAAYPDGRIAAVAHGGGLNFYNIGVDPVRRNLEQMVSELCGKADDEAEKICVGMSALDAPADENTLGLFTTGTIRPGQLDLQSDAYVALMGFALGQPGVIVICGTGSMLVMMDAEGRQHVSGGWGYLLNDAGSGYTLAREGLLAVIEQAEGLGEPTQLMGDALEFFGTETPRGLIDKIYDPECTPDKIAGFARYVLMRAEEGEKCALAILKRNMHRLARHAAKMTESVPEAKRVGLYGGIFAHSAPARNMFKEALDELHPGLQVSIPEFPPELGAVIHLMLKKGPLTEDILNTMKSTYEEYRHEQH